MSKPDDQQSMFADQAPDLKQQIAELEREIQQRKRVYPRLIDKGTLTPQLSAYRIRCLEATIELLQQIDSQQGTGPACPVCGAVET